MQPGYVYTLTTTTGQGKGTAASPAQSTLALPYSDSFDSDTVGQQPRYLSQMQGAFEVEPCAGGRSGHCLQQQAATQPIEWDNNATPYTIGGNLSWANYTVSADALMSAGGRGPAARPRRRPGAFSPANINDYYLQLSNTGAWSIVRNATGGTRTTLASGTVTAPGPGTWQHLSLTFNGHTISAAINGTDGRHGHRLVLRLGHDRPGYLGLPDRPVRATCPSPWSARPRPAGPIVAGDDTADCVDVNGGSSAPGTKVEMWACNGNASSQSWTMASNGTVQHQRPAAWTSPAPAPPTAR